MPSRLHYLDNKRCDSITDLGHALKDAGFDNEFDNSRVMHHAWKKIDELKAATGGNEGLVFFTMKLQVNPVFGSDLIVTLHTPFSENITAQIVLFERDDKITVRTDVIAEVVTPEPSDLPLVGKGVEWAEAEVIFKSNPRFKEPAFAAFKAVYHAACKKDTTSTCTVRMTPSRYGLKVEFVIAGKVVLTVKFDYNN